MQFFIYFTLPSANHCHSIVPVFNSFSTKATINQQYFNPSVITSSQNFEIFVIGLDPVSTVCGHNLSQRAKTHRLEFHRLIESLIVDFKLFIIISAKKSPSNASHQVMPPYLIYHISLTGSVSRIIYIDKSEKEYALIRNLEKSEIKMIKAMQFLPASFFLDTRAIKKTSRKAAAIITILHCGFSRWIHYTRSGGADILR
ncbi:Uncharacterized protein APZ42_010912 [Daphnia magna]|uniref:Uncharacterized protein n=1 Tax=Daphnia magna TaxID=35525 RepID=A0A162TA53_9CRUS|nr:Uncharacterized protein APZ42_010912 [Daphnia magna]